MSKQDHTPTPWFVDDTTVYFRVRKNDYDSEPAIAACGPDSESAAWIDKESDDPKLTQRANAEFIARAANNHAALVWAIRDVRERHKAKAKACNFEDCGCPDCEVLEPALEAATKES